MSHVPHCIALAALAALAGCSPAGERVDERIDALFAPWDRADSPGAAVAVLLDGEVLFARGYGSAQIEHGAPITPETIFHAASVSKQFTAFAICLLASDGKLSLDDPIQKHLAEVPDFGSTITLRHLLHHTSGLRDQWEGLAIAGWRLDDVITTQHVLTFVSHQRELNFEPGTRYLYCNTGYTLLAETVKRVSGMPFQEFCRRRIFDPLGMHSTHFHDDHLHVVPGRAYSYQGGGLGDFRNFVLSYANVGATSLFTTVLDLLRWLENLDTGAVGGVGVQAMLRERYVLNDGTRGDYGLGIIIGERNGQTSISHSGSDAGFSSFVAWYPEQDLGVAVLANLAGLPTTRLADRVAGFCLPRVTPAGEVESAAPEPGPAAPAPVAIELEDSVLERHVGSYRHASGFVVKVTLAEGALMIHADSTLLARPTSENEFFVAQGAATLIFVPGGDGRSRAVIVNRGTGPARLERIEPVEFEPLTLADFVGRFWSEELGTFYDLDIEGEGLVARHRRHGTIQLALQGTDAFLGDRWFFGRIEFQRGEDGSVTGFRMQGDRVKNLLFERR